MRKASFAVTPFIFVISMNAFATDFPRYDPEPHCDSLAGKDSLRMESVYQACIRQEGAAYEWLDDHWKALPKAVRHTCLESNTKESFQTMRNCILAEKARVASS